MRILIMTLCTVLLTGVSATAQKKTPTLDDLIPGGATFRFAEDLYGLKWWGDVCFKPDIDSLFTIHPKTGKETLLFTRETINKSLERPLATLSNLQFPWPEQKRVLIAQLNTYITYDFSIHKIVSTLTINEKADNDDYCPASNSVAYTVGNNLYVNDVRVTDEPAGVVCGAPNIHRNEFGIEKGTFWSPKGALLAFYRMDESMVTQYPLVDITTRIAEINNTRYPMAGMTGHKVSVGIYNPSTQKTIFLQTGDPTDRYFTN